MALGGLHECWVCYQSKRYGNPDFKQTCTPVRGRKRTIVEGILIWLCFECRKNFKHA